MSPVLVQFIVIGQQRAEPADRPGHPRFHRAGRLVQRGGDLVKRQVFVEPQRQQGPRLRFELEQGAGQQPGLVIRDQAGARVRLVDCRRVLLEPVVQTLAPLAAAECARARH